MENAVIDDDVYVYVWVTSVVMIVIDTSKANAFDLRCMNFVILEVLVSEIRITLQTAVILARKRHTHAHEH